MVTSALQSMHNEHTNIAEYPENVHDCSRMTEQLA